MSTDGNRLTVTTKTRLAIVVARNAQDTAWNVVACPYTCFGNVVRLGRREYRLSYRKELLSSAVDLCRRLREKEGRGTHES